jgi:ACS family tartrate transporter-like MFS transporter
MGVLYFINYLDRVNVAFAALTMNRDLGFSATVYGSGAGILFLGYVVFGVPANIILDRIGARRWIACIVIAWGLVASAMAFVQGPIGFYVLRFLLGVAEAGFFPGMILYLTYWFPADVRGRVTGLFLLAIPLSSVFGSPVSALLLGVTGLGLRGWQWLFILQGVPAIVLGFVVLAYLSNSPEESSWLTPREKEWLRNELANEHLTKETIASGSAPFDAIRSWRVWLLGLMYFGTIIGLYGLTLWLPQIVKGFGRLSNLNVGFLTATPYALAAAVMAYWGGRSDRHSERTWHLVIPALVGGLGLCVSAYLVAQPVSAFIALTVAGVGIYAVLPVFWTIPTAALSGTAAAGGIALINIVGNIGGYVGPTLVGYIHDRTHSYGYGLLMLGSCSIMSALIALGFKAKASWRSGIGPNARIGDL